MKKLVSWISLKTFLLFTVTIGVSGWFMATGNIAAMVLSIIGIWWILSNARDEDIEQAKSVDIESLTYEQAVKQLAENMSLGITDNERLTRYMIGLKTKKLLNELNEEEIQCRRTQRP